MPIVIKKYALAYYPSPKVASTSLKMTLYELSQGERWVDYQDNTGFWWHIHNAWLPDEPTPFVTLPNAATLFKFAVIRDPIARFLSAFGNRVHFHKELSAKIIGANPVARELGLLPDPDLATFVERLEEYCLASVSIHHHVRPQTDFIGGNLDYFDRVAKFPQLDGLIGDLRKIAGRHLDVPHEQQKGPKFNQSVLSPSEIAKLTKFYHNDYSVFGSAFPPPREN